MKISLHIEMPPPPTQPVKDVVRKESVYDKVCDYIKRLDDASVDSEPEWRYLKHIYSALVEKPRLNQAEKEILFVLEPVILKHKGYDSGEGQLKIDGTKLFRVKEEDL